MGLDVNAIRFLLLARRHGASLERVAMIGRQGFNLTRAEMARELAAAGLPAGAADLERIFTAHGGYTDGFFFHAGAGTVDSFDASAYEGASHVHDFNQPIPAEFHGRYSLVLDGGTLEHVFHFPTALRNCLEMTRVGGHFVGVSPANNFTGHGFYQISPELYFRAFSAANGFRLRLMVIYENALRPRWRRVLDPEAVRLRGTVVNWRETLLLTLARREAEFPIFAQPPAQSDYQAAWDASRNGQAAGATPGWKDRLPYPVRQFLKLALRRYNPRCFAPFRPEDPID